MMMTMFVNWSCIVLILLQTAAVTAERQSYDGLYYIQYLYIILFVSINLNILRKCARYFC